MDKLKVAKTLRTLRGDKTLREIADDLNIATSTYSMYEAGERIPRDEIKVRIANYFEKTVDSIFFAE